MNTENVLFKHLKTIDYIRSKNDCEEYLKDLTYQFGIQHYWYMTIEKKPASFGRNQIYHQLLFNNYPKEFIEDYLRNDRFGIDPVILNSLKAEKGVLLWDDLFDKSKLNETHAKQLSWAAEYNIENGASTIINEADKFTMLHLPLAKDYNQSPSAAKELIRDILPLTYLLSKKIDQYTGSPTCNRNRPLSAREAECLEWAARGKTIWETATIIGISENTVREYLSNATRKLVATNKTEAVVKAALLNLIDQNCLLDFWKA